MSSRGLGIALALASGCGEYAIEYGLTASSSTMVGAQDNGALYVVNVDEGSVTGVRLRDGSVDTLDVGSEPTRITRGEDRMFVTLRGQREVVALEEGKGGLEVVARREVGAEPYGIVTLPNGGPVYVAVSLENKVVALDSETLEVLEEWIVPDEPRWLGIDPTGHNLFVASHRQGRLTQIVLDTSEVLSVFLPAVERGLFGEEMQEGGDSLMLDVRLTGDPCVTPDGRRLLVPALYVDTMAVIAGDGGEDGGGGYAGGGAEVGRMNPALVSIDVEEQSAETVFVVGDDGPDIRRTSISSATCAPDGRHVLASMEAADALFVVDLQPFERGHGPRVKSESSPDELGFSLRPRTDVHTGRGPRGMAFVGDEPYVHTWLDRQVRGFAWEDALEVNGVAARDNEDARYPVLQTELTAVLTYSSLTPEQEEGRYLFTTALDPRMTTRQGGVSCSTCHVDGREDGVSWPFAAGPRQTPSLAGGVTETAPFTWDGNVDSVGTEALLTTTNRMGGRGPDDDDLALIEAYVATLRGPDTPEKGDRNALVDAGRQIFESSAVGCSRCHSGPRLTDGLNHQVHGTSATNTPSLLGVASSAPYFHDGTYATLRDVLRPSAMANTALLDENDLDALEAYLRSL